MQPTLRDLMLDHVRKTLVRNTAYCESLQQYADPYEHHKELLSALDTITDKMLFNLFCRIERDPNFFVLWVDRPDFLSVRVGRYFGGMSETGEVHT